MVDDDCKCGGYKKVYHLRENLLYEFCDRNRELVAWYKASDSAGEYFEAETYSADTIVDHNKDFKELEGGYLRHTFFTTKEECQKFCDYMNGKEENSGYDYNKEGQMIARR